MTSRRTAESKHRLGRREMLAYLAGVPLLGLAGCDGGRAFSFSGDLLNPNYSVAHRLRDGWRPPPPEGDPGGRRVVIVGGGIAGLAAAWQLSRRGVEDFVVLELEDRPGGTAISGQDGEFRFPWGAHYIPAPMKENRDLVALLEEMDVIVGRTTDGEPVVGEAFLCRDPSERLCVDGRWHYGLYPDQDATESDLRQLERFQQKMIELAHGRDDRGRRLFAIPMATGSDSAKVRALDRQSMAQWMTDNGFDSPRLRWLADYACRDDYGLTLEQTSAWAGLFYFTSRIPAEGTESQPVITWPEGNGRVVRHLAEHCGDRLIGGQTVVKVQNQGEGVRVEAVDNAMLASVAYVADRVIFAAPQFVAPHVVADWNASGRSINSFHYGGWVVANLRLSQRPSERLTEMCWDNVFFDSRSLGYVTSTHQVGLDHGPTVITWYQPLLDDDPRVSRAELMRLDWSDWARVIVSDLRKGHPDIESLIERLEVMRWGHAMIQPRVGFVFGAEREQAAKPIGRVHFAGTDLSGIALLEEAFSRGVSAANAVVQADPKSRA
ncbi:FAD-dependent oxidoreductase [Roseiconus nitratireducens]|uniref:FAD-dependent oxidoreductase n=1 Tax=Roseiconus nitratireducens TaxID=2605748 RepID=UPI0013757E8A|nr:FAD-dependent oxidoreductase [Roseiconus nitratireducens]